MNCEHLYKVNWYRITWSGRFKLVSERCYCGHVRERTLRCQEESSYPSKEWFYCGTTPNSPKMIHTSSES